MNIIYETDKFILTPFLDVDLKKSDYRKWFHDQEVTKHNSHGLFPYTKKEESVWRNKIENNEIIVWAIMAKIMPIAPISIKHIGNISLQSINWINRSAEFAIVIGEKAFWCGGYGTNSLKILIDHGFEKLNLNRIWSGTAETNERMIKVFMNLGMTHEGIFREAVFLNGEYVNVQCWSILKGERK